MLIFYIFLGIDNGQTWLVERINLHCSRRGAKTSTCFYVQNLECNDS